MCRLFVYRGAPLPLSAWLFDAAHSLERQAYAPRELLRGTVNVDGTGMVWWPDGPPEGSAGDTPGRAARFAGPLRYISERPPWSDPNLAHLASRLRGGLQVGAVRSATPGISFGADHVQPFLWEPGPAGLPGAAPGGPAALVGAHNGWIGGFRGPVGRRLAEQIPEPLWGSLGALNDSALLFLLALGQVLDGAGLAEAAVRALGETVRACQAAGEAATLNLLLSTRAETIVTRFSHGAPQNSLYHCERDGQRLVASEPLDAGPWQPVPPDHLVSMTDCRTTLHPILLEPE